LRQSGAFARVPLIAFLEEFPGKLIGLTHCSSSPGFTVDYPMRQQHLLLLQTPIKILIFVVRKEEEYAHCFF